MMNVEFLWSPFIIWDKRDNAFSVAFATCPVLLTALPLFSAICFIGHIRKTESVGSQIMLSLQQTLLTDILVSIEGMAGPSVQTSLPRCYWVLQVGVEIS